MDNGKFIISLDFELMWGVRDHKSINDYGENILGVYQIMPKLLDIFQKYSVKSTFAIVGFLYFNNKSELVKNISKSIPNYFNTLINPYSNYFDNIENDGKQNAYHFAPSLIELIRNHSEHEIGTHTFSHYYCLEKGQTLDNFKSDLEMAISVSKRSEIEITSLVFPRNQFNAEYLETCKELGIICVRGNENSWIYNANLSKIFKKFQRPLKLIDAYINLTGHNTYSDKILKRNNPIIIPSSRFLRPYSKKSRLLEKLRLQRIRNAMTFAAKNNQTFCLWWHPHNFGINQNENILFLEDILIHYNKLNFKYNFQSYTMSGLAKELLHGKT